MSSQTVRHRHGLSISTEHYLRAILELREERGYARVVDIATRLGVTKGSVSLALAHLADAGLVRFDAARFPTLTAAGRRVAQDVRGRFRIVLTFLTDVLGLPAERASSEACRWEHVISHEVADRILDFVRFAKDGEEHQALLEAFRSYRRSCEANQGCEACAGNGPVEIFCFPEPRGADVPSETHEKPKKR
jgi:DtxR family transcriptional regulator, Mn-dependent transcriptional regulator